MLEPTFVPPPQDPVTPKEVEVHLRNRIAELERRIAELQLALREARASQKEGAT